MEPGCVFHHRVQRPLHDAAKSGDVDKVRRLLRHKGGKYKVECPTYDGCTSLHLAASKGHLDVVRVLLSEFKANADARTNSSKTPLHLAASKGHLDVVRILLQSTTNVNACDEDGSTPFDMAVNNNREEVALAMLSHCDTKGGMPYIHTACESGLINLVRALVLKHGTGILKDDVKTAVSNGNTLFDVAVNNHREEVALVLMNEFHCDTKGGTPYIHTACERGWVKLVRALIQKYGTGILRYQSSTSSESGNTLFDVAVDNKHEEVAMVLVSHCDTKGGTPYILRVCKRGWVDLVQALVQKHGTGILNYKVGAKTVFYDIATHPWQKVTVKGQSLLHIACQDGNATLARLISKHAPRTLWMVDGNGDTPLHVCARLGKTECVKALLELDPPVMMRNNLGQTPKDAEEEYESMHFLLSVDGHSYIDDYMQVNTDKIRSHYKLQKHAKKKYSLPEPITRAFVVGNPGAGKSSLVEALKREGLLDSFKRVSEASVPPHTAGIVPSIHTSKHYGRVLFYDFAGDAEYYSSHAAILENLTSARKGENVFLLVIDMREEMAGIKRIFQYWLSFIQHQQFHGQKPRLIVVGSHLDLLTGDMAKARGIEFQKFYDSIDTKAVQMSALFMLDCCKPRSKQISEFQTLMSELIRDSPRFELSFQASILLGLLEKDFSNVPVCSIQTLLTHIKVTGIELPTDTQLFQAILLELHDLGLLFLIDSSSRESSSVVLNMSQLTNIVHKSLFSEEAILKESFEKEGLSFSFSAGIVPLSILAKALPGNITKECLVQLQYCQEITHAEAHVFPSLKMSDSTDQSFLFFPALCSADKSEVAKEGVTPPDLGYGIGWLARCTDPCDYLSPRFHHVLVLRLVFMFTLSADPPAEEVSSGSPDPSHFQRRCTVWKTGVHWLMEEGVECTVELAGANREVVVLTRSTNDLAENCAAVFNDIVSCVMEAKAEFCHSVKLKFFLLDSTSEADYLSADNLFTMRDVERVLTSTDGRAEVIISASGNRQMVRSKLLCLHNFTLWHSLFPMDFKSVLQYIKEVVRELYMLGLHLGIPKGILDAIEVENRTNVSKMRRELVKGWMSSSLDPPCWWHLIKALQAAECGTLAGKIATEFGKWEYQCDNCLYQIFFAINSSPH